MLFTIIGLFIGTHEYFSQDPQSISEMSFPHAMMVLFKKFGKNVSYGMAMDLLLSGNFKKIMYQ